MSIVYVTNVVVGRNPASIMEPFELEISFECLEPLQEDLEWRLVYVGNSDDKTKDQELDSIALGPIQRGALRFIFAADPPDYSKIDKEDINGITIILLSGSYRNQEFVRVGWYIHNFFYESHYIENPPDLDEMSLEEMIPKMRRVILADNPRVTRFNIDWDRPNPETSLMMVNTNEGLASAAAAAGATATNGSINGTNIWNNNNNMNNLNTEETTMTMRFPVEGGGGGVSSALLALDTRMTESMLMTTTTTATATAPVMSEANENIHEQQQREQESSSMCDSGMMMNDNGYPQQQQQSIHIMSNPLTMGTTPMNNPLNFNTHDNHNHMVKVNSSIQYNNNDSSSAIAEKEEDTEMAMN